MYTKLNDTTNPTTAWVSKSVSLESVTGTYTPNGTKRKDTRVQRQNKTQRHLEKPYQKAKTVRKQRPRPKKRDPAVTTRRCAHVASGVKNMSQYLLSDFHLTMNCDTAEGVSPECHREGCDRYRQDNFAVCSPQDWKRERP